MSAHTCHAIGCTTRTSPRLFMCPRHWAMVPKAMQDAIWAAYTPGQERTFDIKDEYFDAAFAARNHVRQLEDAAGSHAKGGEEL